MNALTVQPYLNFNGQADEAIAHYTRAFGAKVLTRMPFGEQALAEEADKVMFAALAVGKTILMVSDVPATMRVESGSQAHVQLEFEDEARLRGAFEALATGGEVKMAVAHMFWGAWFGMVVDRFGVSWMLHSADGGAPDMFPAKVRTCLWFEADGAAAARLYTELVPDSRIETRLEPDASPMLVDLTIGGAPYTFLTAGPEFPQTPAASIMVKTPDQAETDRLWAALTADGGAPGRCGWLTDRFGVSWQIVPEALPELLGQSDRAAAGRAREAMMTMQKIDIAALEAASRGEV